MTSILDYLEIENERKEKLKLIHKSKESEKLLLDAIAYGVFAPLIVDPRWSEVNENLVLKAKAIRMLETHMCIEKEIATEFDALIYLHTASMCVPFSDTWFRIYVYLFQKYFPKHAEKLNSRIDKLSDYEKYELKKLRKWIFQQQVKALKKRCMG